MLKRFVHRLSCSVAALLGTAVLTFLLVTGFRSFAHLLLQAGTLALLSAGRYARLMRGNTSERLHRPDVRAARARVTPTILSDFGPRISLGFQISACGI